MKYYVIKCCGSLPEEFETEGVSHLKKTAFVSGKLIPERNSSYFPSRSDEKIMRDDIKQTITTIREFVDSLGLTKEELHDTLLFVANGSFIENNEQYINKLPEKYKNLPVELDRDQLLMEIYKLSPPLLALETLTNSTMSFISQYTGIKGHNATFGTTSIASFYAIQEGLNALNDKKNKFVMINASNCAGGYSFLSNSTITDYQKDWKESAAIGNVLLSNSNTEEKALCTISLISANKKVPQLFDKTIHRNWKDLLPEKSSDLLIHSGAFDDATFDIDEQYCNSFHPNTYSLFPEFGNMGASNILMSLIEGISRFSNEIRIIDIVDRDIYGRESLIRLEKC